MVGSLRSDHNVLVFDLRGTGRSTPITCTALQNYTGVASGASFAARVGKCGAQLNKTWKNVDGRWVHASDQFTTANATRDLHAALTALNLSTVDLYGDSYGSWFAQAYASRYPADLRSATLDSTYPVLSLDAWSADLQAAIKTAFNVSCTRAPSCSQAVPTTAWDDITALATSLRTTPLSGTTVGLGNAAVTQTLDVRKLIDLVNNAGFDPAVYSQLDAAARSYLNSGDGTALLRLSAWSIGYDNTNSTSARAYSDGLYFANICTDYPQLFTMTAKPAARAKQFAAAVAAEPADTFSPFTPAEWVQMKAYNGAYDACLDWPSPTGSDPPVTKTAPLVSGDVPVLVISGDLDSTTSPTGNSTAATQVGTSARYIEIPNLTHVTAMPDGTWPGPEACGQTLYRQFVTAPSSLSSLNSSCTESTWPIAVLGDFPATVAQVAAPVASNGNQATTTALKASSTAASVVGDAIARSEFLNGTTDMGLRGGSWSSSGNTTLAFTFTNVQWVSDATVSGTATWNTKSGAVLGSLTVTYGSGETETVTVKWNTEATLADAQIEGMAGGKTIAATVAVP